MKHKEWLAKTIKESNGTIQKIAEIGVFEGKLCKYVLMRAHHDIISEYWAIDPWTLKDGYVLLRGDRYTQEDWDTKYMFVCRLMRLFPKLHVVRTTSLEAAKLFPEQYFDLVFIDADHSYKAVLDDIKAWYPLVRIGGIVSGHDYKTRGIYEVKKAVDEFFGDNIEIVAKEKAITWSHKKC